MAGYVQEALVPEPHVAPLPEPNDLPADADGKPLGGKATWTAYRGKHKPCDRCVRIIHQKLWGFNPHPARRRRNGPNGQEDLCLQHGEMQESRDKLAARVAAERAASVKARRR